MRYLVAIAASVALASAALAVQSQPEIPSTPAGRFTSAWLDAFNSADLKKLEQFSALYDVKLPPQVSIDIHGITGRLKPVRVESSAPNEITVLMSAEHGDSFVRQKASMDPSNPMKVANVQLEPADRPPEFALPRMPRAELNRMISEKMSRDVATDRFAGTMIVERHGKVIYRSAAGLADRTTRVPVTFDTRFRIGSANKMFTAVGVLQLVEKGEISLDAPVGEYLKDYPNQDFAKMVTVRQLLTHTGGAGNIFTPEYDAKRLEVRTPQDYVSLFGSRAPDTSANGKNTYANYGFVLLGRILEVASGQDYYDYVQKHILSPAGMKDTGSLPEEIAVPNRSRGYTKKDGKLVDNAGTLPYRGSPAGGGYTTAADLIRFGNALRSGKLLSKVMLKQATSPQRPDGWYGLGFSVGGQGVTRNWGHGGGVPGMNAAFRVYPELDAVVVVLANLDPTAADNQADYYANRMALGE